MRGASNPADTSHRLRASSDEVDRMDAGPDNTRAWPALLETQLTSSMVATAETPGTATPEMSSSTLKFERSVLRRKGLLKEPRSISRAVGGSCPGSSRRTHVTRPGQDYIPRIMRASGEPQHRTEPEVTHRGVGIPEGPACRLCVSAFHFLS